MPKKTKRTAQLDPLEAIKRLLAMQLLSQGVSAEIIASVLEISPGRLSQIIPARDIKPKTRK